MTLSRIYAKIIFDKDKSKILETILASFFLVHLHHNSFQILNKLQFN